MTVRQAAARMSSAADQVDPFQASLADKVDLLYGSHQGLS